jgi:mannose-6-phosphate isomerase-like protein (cupin superfamily)
VGPGTPEAGIRGFGINAFRAGREGDAVVEDHVESPGQEELYVVVRGRARLVVGEETIDAPAGTAVFVPQPDVRRRGVAPEDGTVVLAVGGWRDQPYHPQLADARQKRPSH